jgi:hypothetical protein
MDADKHEIRRLEKALAAAERMWRAERANAKLFKELYESKLAPPKPLHWWERWLTRRMGGHF